MNDNPFIPPAFPGEIKRPLEIDCSWETLLRQAAMTVETHVINAKTIIKEHFEFSGDKELNMLVLEITKLISAEFAKDTQAVMLQKIAEAITNHSRD
jgi:hypothetical protein